MKAVDAGNMLWVDHLMQADVDLPLDRLEAALGRAVGHGFTPIVKTLQPVVMRRQRTVLHATVTAVMRDRRVDGDQPVILDVQRERRRL